MRKKQKHWIKDTGGKLWTVLINFTRLKNKIEKNTSWEGTFYQSECVKINWIWVILVFSLYMCCCKCIRIVFYVPFSKYWTLFMQYKTFISNMKLYLHVNLPALADDNQLECKNVRFLSKMIEINSWWIVSNL